MESEPKTVAICGSQSLRPTIDDIEQCVRRSGVRVNDVIVRDCHGVDSAAAAWARSRHIPVTVIEANWLTYGPGAGVLRNNEIAKRADALIAVWNGKSTGIKHLISRFERLDKVLFWQIREL